MGTLPLVGVALSHRWAYNFSDNTIETRAKFREETVKLLFIIKTITFLLCPTFTDSVFIFSHRPLRLHEILEEVEKPIEDDTDGEDKGAMKESENQITIYITPPDDGNETDEDSGEEDHVEIRNLTGSQLLSEAELRTNESPCIQEDSTPQDDMQEDNAPQPSSSKSISRKSGRKYLKIRQTVA